MHYQHILHIVTSGLLSIFRQSEVSSCRCRSWEKCWPTEKEWKAFNTSVDGALVRLRPIGFVCHEPKFDRNQCEKLLSLSRNSAWRASQPGALQDWVWEGGLAPNESCMVGASAREMPCNQGRIPFYSVIAKSTQHIQKAVVLAKKRKLRLVIRNTGHDNSGRSSAPDSLQVYTHLLKGLQYHDDFRALGADRGSGTALSIGAGEMQMDVYQKGAREGFTVVGGACPTVGAVGGFLQGGGVSTIYGHTRGLAIDNVLEFQVVTSSGEHVTANAFRNQDLFWALRGGGGGTFGTVTQATVRVFPDDPAVVSTVTISLPSSRENLFWRSGVAGLLTVLQIFNKEGSPGTLIIHPSINGFLQTNLTMYFSNTTAESDVENRVRKHMAASFPLNGIHYTLSTKVEAHISSELRMVPDIYSNDVGILTGSVLVSERLLTSRAGPDQMAKTFASLPMGSEDVIFTSNLGGQMSLNGNVEDTAIHPAWRHSAQLINFVRGVNPSIDGKMSALKELTTLQMPILYSLEGSNSRVSYRNMGDPNEKDFQRVYWGDQHYERLLKIKQKWDKDDLFITRLGVGSEKWDDEGMCRTQNSMRSRYFEGL